MMASNKKILVKGKKTRKPKIKEVELKDKTYKYTKITQLANKANITIQQAKDLNNNIDPERIIVNKRGDFKRFNVSNSLVLQEFGIKRIPNKKFLQDGVKIKDDYLFKEIPEGKKVNIIIKFVIVFYYNKKKFIRRPVMHTYCKPKDIQNIVNFYVNDYIANIPVADYSPEESHFFILSSYSEQIFRLINSRLKDSNPLSLHNYYSNIDNNANVDCVKAFLKKKLKKLSAKTINNLGNEEGITPLEIIELCKIYSIQAHVFNRLGGIEIEYLPEKKNKSYPILNLISHNNHCYEIIGTILKKVRQSKYKIEYVDNGRESILKIINSGIEPSEIKIDGENILSFVNNDIKYICNKKYDNCLNILKIWNLENKIFDTIAYSHMFEILESKYLQEKVLSWWPQSNIYCKGGFLYKSKINFDKSKVCTIDKNKHYSCALKALPFLIHFDYRINDIIDKPIEIIDHYLYIVVPKISSILLPETNIYSGYHLKYCKNEGLEFDILEEMTTNKTFNYYTKMIDEIFDKVDNNIAKKIVCRGIGKMERSAQMKTVIKTKGLFNNEESKCHSGYKLKLNDKYNILYDCEEKIICTYTKKPIAIQIKDMARQIVYEKMKELKITQENLVQICTDSISYIGKLPNNLDSNNIDGWKKEEYKEIPEGYIYNNMSNISFKPNRHAEYNPKDDLLNCGIIEPLIDDEPKEYNTVCNCYAGAGKTHKIINEIIPNLPKDKTYIVLTPTHVSLETYKNNKINCGVIQGYSLNNLIPREDIIIIDEFGMCDKGSHDVIYKCFMLNKIIYAYGDVNQLPPVNSDGSSDYMNSKHYFNLLFSVFDNLNTNYRNHFTIKYYDSLINEDINYREEVIKYSTKTYHEAEYIICWYNKTVKKYNDLMLKHLKIDKYNDGVKLMCITNDLRDKNLYNKFEVSIISNKDNLITLSNGLTFTKTEIDKYFIPAYARTVYGVQSKSIKSYYFPQEPTKGEDDELYYDLKQLDGKRAYTIISRLKTK